MVLLHATDVDFKKEVFNSKGNVIVDFWAEWCGPCKMLGPVFEELSKDYDGKITFVKANTEEAPKSAGELGVMSIPCLVFFKDGKETGRIVGFRRKDKLKEEIDKVFL